jgi:hypothetical protein
LTVVVVDVGPDLEDVKAGLGHEADVEWMRNGGEGQYDRSPAPADSMSGTAPLRPRRKADRPAWMDRVRPHATTP